MGCRQGDWSRTRILISPFLRQLMLACISGWKTRVNGLATVPLSSLGNWGEPAVWSSIPLKTTLAVSTGLDRRSTPAVDKATLRHSPRGRQATSDVAFRLTPARKKAGAACIIIISAVADESTRGSRAETI